MIVVVLVAIFLIIAAIDMLLGVKKYNLAKSWKGYKVISYTLNKQKLQLVVADTKEKSEKGLMYREHLDGVDGMIFYFNKKDYMTFWNENTFMDLDVYWLDGKKVTGTSYLPSIRKTGVVKTISSEVPVNVVIEVPHK